MAIFIKKLITVLSYTLLYFSCFIAQTSSRNNHREDDYLINNDFFNVQNYQQSTDDFITEDDLGLGKSSRYKQHFIYDSSNQTTNCALPITIDSSESQSNILPAYDNAIHINIAQNPSSANFMDQQGANTLLQYWFFSQNASLEYNTAFAHYCTPDPEKEKNDTTYQDEQLKHNSPSNKMDDDDAKTTFVKCALCKCTLMRNNMATHMRSLHLNQKFACCYCNLEMPANASNMRRHLKQKHNFTKYMCSHCGQVFSTERKRHTHSQKCHLAEHNYKDLQMLLKNNLIPASEDDVKNRKKNNPLRILADKYSTEIIFPKNNH